MLIYKIVFRIEYHNQMIDEVVLFLEKKNAH